MDDIDITEVRFSLLTETTEVFVRIYEPDGEHVWYTAEFDVKITPVKILGRIWANKQSVPLTWETREPLLP